MAHSETKIHGDDKLSNTTFVTDIQHFFANQAYAHSHETSISVRIFARERLIDALETYRRKRAYYFSSLLVTDVVLQSSLLLVVGDQEFINQIDYPHVETGIYELRDVVSRKKQLLPYLTHCLKQAEIKAK